MTPPEHPRPADAARHALRAAREEARAEGDGAGPAAEQRVEAGATPDAPREAPEETWAEGEDVGPATPGRAEAGAARDALRVARERLRAGRDGADQPAHGTAETEGGETAVRADRGAGEDGDFLEAPVSRGPAGAGTAPGGGIAPRAAERSGGTGPRPGDVARAALRAAAAGRRDDGEEPSAGASAPSACTADSAPGEAAAPEPTAPGGAGGRPGDAAREALRAARREALRAEEAEPRRHKRAPERTGHSSPRASAGSTRARAAQDMRHYLANAFRMPEPDGPDDGTPAPSDPSPTVSTPPDPGPTASAPVAPPHVPPTMATPHRDTELRRTFPAFPVREAAGADVPFAGTWWGNAWVEALEEGALDPKRLARGRGYADQGNVDAITVTPGLVLAYVRGSRPRPYRVQVRLRTLTDDDWARFLDTAADRPGHIAALLDKELPQSLADCGVPLLPGPGDLAPHCSCPDSGHPCKHAAALCYQTARLLDADPFVLLLLRGRGEKDLLDALSRRSAARAAREQQPRTLPGVRAAEALAPRELPSLPPPLPVPPHPEQPPAYPGAPDGPDAFALDQLATDAAARAHALLGTGRDPVGELTLWQDAVRLAAARPGSGLTAATRKLYSTLAAAAGRTPADLARAVAAWRQGGLEGLAVLEEPWDPPAGRFDRARPLLLAADLPAFRPWRNRLTHPRGHVQLRLGHDGLWYAYESEPGQEDWWPRGTPDLDPVGALTGLGHADDL
ncbi:hypothetical protein GCM10010503_45570 [Streptomyces lucensis JCM 4490]|uniref:SWIM-type domain-containing protein n=1 Tax=Streptomyces lucensis JCM 4490 TaxID=1306176 RepID=A0A918J9Y9_9ACTN|nr:SWIM zinc finger family protein [Streptomyces lucensis]GGW63385.1 hypothetical protein GCM10010503_45570 [Streptomyces lucensis JCM 4490]